MQGASCPASTDGDASITSNVVTTAAADSLPSYSKDLVVTVAVNQPRRSQAVTRWSNHETVKSGPMDMLGRGLDDVSCRFVRFVSGGTPTVVRCQLSVDVHQDWGECRSPLVKTTCMPIMPSSSSPCHRPHVDSRRCPSRRPPTADVLVGPHRVHSLDAPARSEKTPNWLMGPRGEECRQRPRRRSRKIFAAVVDVTGKPVQLPGRHCAAPLSQGEVMQDQPRRPVVLVHTTKVARIRRASEPIVANDTHVGTSSEEDEAVPLRLPAGMTRPTTFGMAKTTTVSTAKARAKAECCSRSPTTVAATL